MELHHLRTFVVVAEEQNVTRAAKRLFMTPPAVSAHIKALEEELNITLFVRLPHGMQLTDKGALLRDKAHQILQAAQDLVNHATQMQDYLMGRLVIGLNASPGLLRIAPLITHMKETCPGIELAFVTSVSGTILQNLHSHVLDAGFIFGASPYENVESVRLTVVDLVVAAPTEWEAQIRHAQWEDLARLPWICSTGYCPFQVMIDEVFRQRGCAYQPIAQTDDEMTKCELVSAGLGLALLERSEADEAAQAGKLVVWPHDPIPCALSLAVMKDRQADPLIAALRSHILDMWNRSGDG